MKNAVDDGLRRGRADAADRTVLIGVRDAETPDTHKSLIAEHPVVRTHPETGRTSLYINYTHTACIKGWTEKESRPLLQYLFQRQVRPEFTRPFTWQRGSLTFWDNHCAQHNPFNGYHGHRRVMHRIRLGGEKVRESTLHPHADPSPDSPIAIRTRRVDLPDCGKAAPVKGKIGLA